MVDLSEDFKKELHGIRLRSAIAAETSYLLEFDRIIYE